MFFSVFQIFCFFSLCQSLHCRHWRVYKLYFISLLLIIFQHDSWCLWLTLLCHTATKSVFCNTCGCSAGCVLVLLQVVNVVSAFTKCYPVNDQEYCFYTDGSVLSWDDAREFCGSLNSTLSIITDEDIDNVFQRFISDSNNTNNYVWLDGHANESAQLHWINRQPSG